MVTVCKSEYFPLLYSRVGHLVELRPNSQGGLHSSGDDDKDWRGGGAIGSLFSPLLRSKLFSKDSRSSSRSSISAVGLTWSPECNYTCKWFESSRYNAGCQPAVALSNRGWVVVMHKSEIGNSLYYRVGRLDKFDKTIDWRNEAKLDGHTGTMPAVRFPNLDGLTVEMSYELLPEERRQQSSSSIFDDEDVVEHVVEPDRRVVLAQIVERGGDWGIELKGGTGTPRFLREVPVTSSYRTRAMLDGKNGLCVFSGRSLLSSTSPTLFYSTIHGPVVGPPRKIRFEQLFFVEANVVEEVLTRYDASPEATIDGQLAFYSATVNTGPEQHRDTRSAHLFASLTQAFRKAHDANKITRLHPVTNAQIVTSFPQANIISTSAPFSPWFSEIPVFSIIDPEVDD